MLSDETSFPTQLETPSFEPGQLLAGRFAVVRFLAAGGVGEVYEAMDRELGERVALKVLRPESAGRERELYRFRREVQLARKVTHSNVCRLFEFLHEVEADSSRQSPFSLVVMELLEGETLTERLDRVGSFTPEQALPIVRQIAAALEAAHQVGIVHRDLKSSNIVLVPGPQGERAVVTDFGLARFGTMSGEAASGGSTQTGEFAGTPAYMAPEQLEGRQVTPAVDVYALGILTYRMITGGFPFEGPTPLAVAFERLRKDPRSPRELLPDLDPRWENAILRALAREPKERFSSALGFVEALEGGEVEDREGRASAGALGSRMGLIVIFAAALVLVGLLVWQPWRSPAPTPVPAPGGNTRRSIAVLGVASPEGHAELAWLGPALAEMLATELAAGGLVLIPSESRERSAEDLVASGKCTKNGDVLQLEVQVAEAHTGKTLVEVVEEGSESDVLGLIARTGEKLRAGLARPAG